MRRRLLISYLSITLFVLLVLEIPLGFAYAQSERRRLNAAVQHDALALSIRAEDAIESNDLARVHARRRTTTSATPAVASWSIGDDGMLIADSDPHASAGPRELLEPARAHDRARRPGEHGHPPLRHARRDAAVLRGADRARQRPGRRAPGDVPDVVRRRSHPPHLVRARRARRADPRRRVPGEPAARAPGHEAARRARGRGRAARPRRPGGSRAGARRPARDPRARRVVQPRPRLGSRSS